jgi:hypothetical protein
MKKLIAIGTFVFGVVFFAQAQSSVPATNAPKKSSTVTEAPRPNNDAAGLRPSTNSPTPSTSASQGGNSRSENTQLQPSGVAPSTTRTTTTAPSRGNVVNPDNRVNVGTTAPVISTTPVVKPSTPVAPKN